MKGKKTILMLTTLALIVLMTTPVFANGVRYDSDLIAGQYTIVGEVRLYFNNDHTMLYIDLETAECSIIETHIWVGDDLEDVPRTGSGNPKIGQFPFAVDHEPSTTEFTQEIDVSLLSGTVYVLIHAVVDCPCIGKETAWGEGDFATPFADRQDIFGSRWGYFITITV